MSAQLVDPNGKEIPVKMVYKVTLAQEISEGQESITEFETIPNLEWLAREVVKRVYVTEGLAPTDKIPDETMDKWSVKVLIHPADENNVVFDGKFADFLSTRAAACMSPDAVLQDISESLKKYMLYSPLQYICVHAGFKFEEGAVHITGMGGKSQTIPELPEDKDAFKAASKDQLDKFINQLYGITVVKQ